MNRAPKIGAYVLETLTTGMYVYPLDTVRELVQNSADSIRKAEESSLLKKGEGRIQINVGPKNRSLIVRDNGKGITTDEAGGLLIDVGMSDKEIEHDAGFRGIGRLAGIAFCDALKFRTSAKGENRATVIEFDCVGILKAISPSNRRRFEMADVLSKYVIETTEPAKAADHFFEVTMTGISDASTDFLSVAALEEYLSQVAPVDYDPEVFIDAPKIHRWVKQKHIDLPVVNLVVSDSTIERQVFKPYRNRYCTSYQREQQHDVELEDVAFFYDEKEQFWIWYGVSDLSGMVGDDRVAGFRLRKNNIALGGPEPVAEIFAEKAPSNRRFNSYYVGEIHILCPEAIPNARRDGFENGGAWPKIRARLRPFVDERSSDIRKSSEAKNSIEMKLTRQAKKVIATVDTSTANGLASVEERDSLLNEVQTTREKIEDRLAKGSAASNGKELKPLVKKLQKVEVELESDKHFLAKKVRPSLDRKQRKLLQDVVGIIHSTLEEQSCKKARECADNVRSAIFEKYGAS
jgi:Histidine kinase-, DNA gyrase B-, and HSP90-like ATPase